MGNVFQDEETVVFQIAISPMVSDVGPESEISCRDDLKLISSLLNERPEKFVVQGEGKKHDEAMMAADQNVALCDPRSGICVAISGFL